MRIDIDRNDNEVPKPKLLFKIKPRIVDDKDFQNGVKEHLKFFSKLRNKYNYNLIEWWESMIKPGIKNLAILKTKESIILDMGN